MKKIGKKILGMIMIKIKKNKKIGLKFKIIGMIEMIIVRIMFLMKVKLIQLILIIKGNIVMIIFHKKK